jgi:hypothetical protein
MTSTEQRNQSEGDARWKRSRIVKSEVIPEGKSLVNVLYICEVNNCGYNCECSNKIAIKSITHELISVAET